MCLGERRFPVNWTKSVRKDRRELIHLPYRIIYRVVPSEARIDVVAVVHSARLLVQ
ncbi:MAG: type II toxin-antitoxin system RelE/ParE family toxin [Acidobacteria bacterium]|nr:type II toxin-antitoxin system RelE/ParE family toxin [Acidobacteriota bacterium]